METKSDITLESWNLTPRQLCDVELILNGGFSPLKGFLCQQDYQSVLETLRLADGSVWPIPITLDVSEAFSEKLALGQRIILRDLEGLPIASLTIEDKWKPDKKEEAKKVFGTEDITHPAVSYLFKQAGDIYFGGTLTKINLPTHYDFTHLRLTPQDLKKHFKKLGWDKVIAFQTRNPMHRAHQQLTLNAAKEVGANVLIHPVVGMTKPGDIDYFTRVRCYEKIIPQYPTNSVMLSLLPLAMRMGGPREALWHAIIRKNYGCTHFIVGRDHAGPGNDSEDKPFYDPYEAQALVSKYEDEIDIKMLPFQEMVYVKNKKHYRPLDQVKDKSQIAKISGTEFRHRLRTHQDIPSWFSFPEVIQELKKTIPPKDQQGFTVFFTGLSAAGKSTIAQALLAKLLEVTSRPVTLLDGDIVRKHLSSELGFSKEHRDINITRIGYVASEITKHRGIVICAPIAPYAETRAIVRDMISKEGQFIEIYISTPLNVCEDRDPKGLYAKARAGILKSFTGINDPYEAPMNPELTIDTSKTSVSLAINTIFDYLLNNSYLKIEA
jgi:sulfate adenylyltransferase